MYDVNTPKMFFGTTANKKCFFEFNLCTLNTTPMIFDQKRLKTTHNNTFYMQANGQNILAHARVINNKV